MPKKASKKPATKSKKKIPRTKPQEALLASGGGSGPAAGVTFQGGIGAFFASIGMGQRTADERLELGSEIVERFRFETEAPVDDMLITTSGPGRLFFQAKTNLSFSTGSASEMAKTVEQIVRLWRLCEEGDGSRGWNRPLDRERDRFVIAVGAETPATVSVELARALLRNREGATPDVTPRSQKNALTRLIKIVQLAWRTVYGVEASEESVSRVLDLIVVARFDFQGADLGLGAEILSSSLADPKTARAAFQTLAGICEERMKRRTGFSIPEIRRVLERKGIKLLAPPDYRGDHNSLTKYSDQVLARLSQSSVVTIDDETSIPIPRPVADAATNAAAIESLLIVGEPGAGKTGVLVNVARQLKFAGRQVLVLAVENAGSAGLKADLGLSHPVRDVLENWPDTDAAYLLIDGLDAARGGPAEAVYRGLIADTLTIAEQRWKVIATVRSFDLKAGQQLKSLFKGPPPDANYCDPGPDFSNVRHIQVGLWGELEFEQLLSQAPKLRKAIDKGGTRLREIALIPFNTQLLAEVVAMGVPESELGSIKNQTELLKLYWNHRIESFGSEAAACLNSLVATMVKERSLKADAAPVRQSHAQMLDHLLRVGVLVMEGNGRFLGFRHNILFDYAASRLYLNPFDPNQLRDLFLRDRGLGLILSPALGYALQELWDNNSEHKAFWDLVILLASDQNVDPVARSMIASRSCELVRSVADIQHLVNRLGDGAPASAVVLSALAGALTILLEDSPQAVEITPWAHLIAELSASPNFAGTVGYLVEKLLKLHLSLDSFKLLGLAARNLLERAFGSADSESNRNLAGFGVGYVARTYASDPKSSRVLLEKIFDKERLKEFAHIEVLSLAREIASIASNDADFTVTIYGLVFGFDVQSQKETRLSPSNIMPMSSNESQDYDLARYSLAQHFTVFLDENPQAATAALVGALEGHIEVNHTSSTEIPEETLHIGETSVLFREDGSWIWGWDINSTHPESMEMMLQRYVAYLREADAEKAGTIVSVLFAKNRTAIMWARLLMVAAERPEIFADSLWHLATNERILLSSDTRKDAIDAIAAFYPLRTPEERRAFEQAAFTHGAKDLTHESVRQKLLGLLFRTIGQQNLITDEARILSVPESEEAPIENSRPFSISGGAMPFTPQQWLQEQGVDLENPVHSELLALSEAVKKELVVSYRPLPRVEDIATAVEQLRQLRLAITNAEEKDANKNVIRNAQGALSDGCTAILDSAYKENATISEEDLSIIKEIAVSLSRSSDSELGFSPRAGAVPQLFYLCQRHVTADAALGRLEELLTDPNPMVRQIIARNLSTLLNFAPAKMWELAERVVTTEKESVVMADFVAAFLGNLRNLDPDRVESMLIQVQERFPFALPSEEARPRQYLDEAIAGMTAMLYVWNGREKSRVRLFHWAANPLTYGEQIRTGLFQVRQAVCDGYDSDDPERQAARERVQLLLKAVVERSAEGLEQHYAQDAHSQKNKRAEALVYAKCLEYACASFYFGSGAFREQDMPHTSPIQTNAGKLRFVTDVQPIFKRLGDIAISHTVYELVRLLDFLLPAEPAVCFDLFAHALTTSGRKHGFQTEMLGVDVLVRVVGRCLADHDQIFRDTARREQLIACLDIFIEAGWPAALRLLYRLPDALR